MVKCILACGLLLLLAPSAVAQTTSGLADSSGPYGQHITGSLQVDGPIKGDISGTSVTATGGTTARTQADRAADVSNVLDKGAKCDGVTDDAATIQAAINSAASAGKKVVIPSATCLVNSTLTLPANSDISGLNGSMIKAGVSGTIFSATSVSGVYIHDLNLNGNYPTTTAFQPVISFSSVTGSQVVNLNITNPAGEIRLVSSSGNLISRVVETNSHQHGVALTGSCDNRVLDNQFNGQAGFGIIVQNGACRNLIQGNSDTTSGLELVGITNSAFDNRVIGNDANSTGDNCYSSTGYRNIFVANRGYNCQGNGLEFYGQNNTASGNTFIDNAQGHAGNGGWVGGIVVSPSFGGTGQHNVAVGNIILDDQVVPTTLYGLKIFPDVYPVWVSGASVAASAYYFSGLNLYQSVGAGTTGATAPTCTSGTCSDGTVTWAYVGTFDGSTAPDWNKFGWNDVRGASSGIWQDSSSAPHNQGIACFRLETTNNSFQDAANSCSGVGSMVAGQNNTVSGGTSAAFGSSHNVTGGAAFAANSSNVVDANYATVLGKQGATRGIIAAFCHGGVDFSTVGDKQWCHYEMGATLSTTSQTRLTTDGTSTQAATNMMFMPNNGIYEVSCKMIARNQSTGDAAEFSINDALFQHATTGVSTLQVGSTAWTTGPATAGAVGVITPAIIADTTLAGVALAATASSGTWHVTASCDTTQTQ